MKNFFCSCGEKIFFENFKCMACGASVGFDAKDCHFEIRTCIFAAKVIIFGVKRVAFGNNCCMSGSKMLFLITKTK